RHHSIRAPLAACTHVPAPTQRRKNHCRTESFPPVCPSLALPAHAPVLRSPQIAVAYKDELRERQCSLMISSNRPRIDSRRLIFTLSSHFYGRGRPARG